MRSPVSTAFRLIRSFGHLREERAKLRKARGLNRLSADSVFWTNHHVATCIMIASQVSTAFRLIRSFGHAARRAYLAPGALESQPPFG